MANPLFKHLLVTGMLCAGTTLLFTGCIDDSYDLDKVDLTMKLNTDGLGVKLGNTDLIALADILDEDETVKTEANGLYYLVKDGTSNFNVKVDNMTTSFNDTKLDMNTPVLQYNDVFKQLQDAGIPVTEGNTLPIPANFEMHGSAEGDQEVDFKITDVSDVKQVKTIDLQKSKVALTLTEANQPASLNLGVTRLKNVRLYLPKFLGVTDVAPGWELQEGNVLVYTHNGGTYNYDRNKPEICSVYLNKVALDQTKNEGKVENGNIELKPYELNVRMTAEQVYFENRAGRELSMNEGDQASVRLDIKVPNNKLNISQVTGIFNPAIDPDNERIDVSNDLPDFLQDKEVRIVATNPTIRFHANMSTLPVGIDMRGTLTAVKENGAFENGATTKVVKLDKGVMEMGRDNYVYYCNQGNTPYDPEGAKAGAATVKNTANIGDLITELPDYLEVDLKNNQINVKNEYYTVQLGRDYHVDADYSVFVPFEFDRGLKVVYNDSTESMHSDLKDLSATGTLEVMADAYNTIPLELLVGLKAVDVDGNVVPVEFNTVEAHVAPGHGTTYTMNGGVKQRSDSEVMTPIKITAKLDDKDLLSRIDKLCFNIHADATGSNKLVSTQYLKLNNIKIKLHAGVIADFN
ncbi:hypothetical protein [uncultured Prevotellamassilia sp.]|uniref:hypothetical protein n=1 Tax=uncultured Prevotellamassilia sp. TaxID=1926676 RepID=UPI00259451E4|nr:hypothetical protein [uncultured Prevotellamassilia sp.]